MVKNTLVHPQKIILGLDPGTRVTGYGIIRTQQDTVHIVTYGVIHLHKYKTHELRLKKIFERVLALIDEFHPDEVALEAPFYGKNVQAMLKLGRAQGIAMAAALLRQIPIVEYAPKKIKMAVTGNGNASKEQVAELLKTTFHLKPMPGTLLDATDALAVASCHYFNTLKKKQPTKASTWNSFIEKNPDRVVNP